LTGSVIRAVRSSSNARFSSGVKPTGLTSFLEYPVISNIHYIVFSTASQVCGTTYCGKLDDNRNSLFIIWILEK